MSEGSRWGVEWVVYREIEDCSVELQMLCDCEEPFKTIWLKAFSRLHWLRRWLERLDTMRHCERDIFIIGNVEVHVSIDLLTRNNQQLLGTPWVTEGRPAE